MSYNPTKADDDKPPLLCRIFGHKFRYTPGFYTIGTIVKQDCARKGCTASREVVFYVDRSVI